MGKSIVMHIDEAPWLRGEARKPGDPMTAGSQLIGDLKEGPWIHIHSVTPGMVIKPHTHSEISLPHSPRCEKNGRHVSIN